MLAVTGQLDRVAWFHSAQRHDIHLILSMAAIAVLAGLCWIANSQLATWQQEIPAYVLSVLHIAAMALVLHRAPWSPAARAAGLLAFGMVLPALMPTLRPLLDASPAFHDPHLPRAVTALAPILALIVFAFALPRPSDCTQVRTAIL